MENFTSNNLRSISLTWKSKMTKKPFCYIYESPIYEVLNSMTAKAIMKKNNF